MNLRKASNKRIGALCAALAGSLLSLPLPAAAADRVFVNPQVHGMIVDNCAVWGNNCGWGGAHQFCQMQGYAAARSWQLNRPGRTYVLGSRQVCQGSYCVGFWQVVCMQAGGGNPQQTTPNSGGTANVNVSGRWSWSLTCTEGSYGGLLDIGALATDGSFSGVFHNGHGNMQGRVQGNRIEFVRSFGHLQDRWFALASASRMDQGVVQPATAGKANCSFAATRA